MTSIYTTQQARRAEDDYFRRLDAELIARARQTTAQDADASGPDLERRALGEALGVDVHDPVGTLHAAGFRANNVALLDWLPAIDVAWTDDLDVHERHALRLQIAADPRVNDAAPSPSFAPSLSMMGEFLFIQPSEELMAAARDVLRRQLAAMDPASRSRRFDTIIARCEAVAEASGGVWILGPVSAEEHRRIGAMRAGLADADGRDADPPFEFPH